MAAHTRVAVGYNVQVAVDTKHKLIVEQQVTNQVVDMGLLTQTAAPAKEVLGVETIAVVADRGYFKIEDIEACEQAGIEPYVPRPQRGPSVKAGLFLGAFLRNPLKRVNAAQPHLQLVTAQLLDRLAEALGDAPLTVRLGLGERRSPWRLRLCH